MKKTGILLLALLLAALLLCGCTKTPVTGEPDADSITASVTISDAGTLVVTCKEIEVTDADGDGVITIAEVLAASHTKYYADGTEGFACEDQEYGLAVTRLWGVEGGSYGYAVNNVMAMNLSQEVNSNDLVCAYNYSDLTAWSDVYSYFDRCHLEAKVGEEIALSLFCVQYDEEYNELSLPLAGASITVNGESSGTLTDDNGNFVLVFDEPGSHVVSAVSDEQVLVPPCCVVEILP